MSSKRAATNGFNVEPGSYGSVSAVAAAESWSARWLAIARTSPVAGSMITISPPVARIDVTASASERSAMSWSDWLIESTTVLPCVGAWSVTFGERIR